jgi:polyisoprenyl-teichoic acid--peptidoglycan teichoic acid transferase
MSDPSRGTPRRRSRPRLRNQLLFVVGILLLAGGAFYTALVVATQIDHIFFPDTEITLGGGLVSKLPLIDKGTAGELSGGRINVLVMGLDKRPTEGNVPSRTDTMFVMTVDPTTRTARGLAMPRDLWVDIPSKTGNTTFKERINAAYVIGELQNYQGGGPGLAKQTVERLLGIKINYYVAIDFEGFKQVIDLLGGIDVDVASPGVNDPEYSDTERRGDYYPCIFKPGLHHMNGTDALCYARVRRGSSDLDRILRQQRVIFAVMDKASQLKVMADPGNVTTLWKRYKSSVNTDINDFQIPGFAKLAQGMDPDQLAFLSLGPATSSYRTPQGADVLVYSKEGVQQIVDALMSDNRLLAEAATVELQNGTNQAGQASKASEYLQSLGIPHASLTVLNAVDQNHAKTEIIDYSGKSYTADKLAAWLGVPRDRVRRSTEADLPLRNSQSDIVIILGADAKLESAIAQPATTR